MTLLILRVIIMNAHLGVAQLGERHLGVVEVARSNRVTQTKNSVENEQVSTEFLFCFCEYTITNRGVFGRTITCLTLSNKFDHIRYS